MSFDYAPLAQDATDLIAEFGQDVVLTRASRSADLDVWETDQGPTATSESQSITVKAVQGTLDIERDGARGQATRRAVWILEPSSAVPEELGPQWSLTANGVTYKVVTATPVKPGDTLMVTRVVVEI